MAPNIPLPSEGAKGEDSKKTATATCFCGAVQILFPTDLDDYMSFVCNCADCHKITASVFATNFVLDESVVTHTRGKDKLTKFAQKKTVGTGNMMENNFCSVCGTLMYRIGQGFPGKLITRVGTVDDFTLQETILKPRIEQFLKQRAAWLPGLKDVEHANEMYDF